RRLRPRRGQRPAPRTRPARGAGGAARPAGRRDQRRGGGRARRAQARGGARGDRPRDADARDRRGRGRRDRGPPLRRMGRARAHGDRRRRRAVPWRVHRPRPRRGVLLGHRRRPRRRARARGGGDRARARRPAAPGPRRDRPVPRRGDRHARERLRPGGGGRRRRVRARRGGAPARARTAGRPPRGARPGRRARAPRARRAGRERRPDRRRARRARCGMTLAVCATPIGNADDVTLRVLAELRTADVVLAEDTRRTRTLLARHGIEAALLSYHEHNEAARVAELLPRLAAGERVALVSDAGLPAISDPGARLVRAALEAGVAVTVLPGPSAVETALVASGLVAERYAFVGFLPRRAGELAALWHETASWAMPVVAFESPRRLPATLRSLAAAFPEREAAVCRELTKVFEEVVRGTAAEL